MIKNNTPHILVVEDSPILQKVTCSSLRSLGYETSLAKTGEEAVTLALKANRKFTLVLMDVGLPGISGITATKQIRSQLTPEELPIIGYSAEKQNQESSLQSGMNEFYVKPLPTERLEAIIQRVSKSQKLSLKLPNTFFAAEPLAHANEAPISVKQRA
jgi:CheY-like chemotaxis protein